MNTNKLGKAEHSHAGNFIRELLTLTGRHRMKKVVLSAIARKR
ncbi:MAG TPA: hypothetical protein VK892_12335 [Pyrinomonadaceae bacterium]|nr:hypothetical protein [Pyrinomonadaceae bacterium]